MKNGFRQSMAWLHAWSGLVVGWVLFAVFVTGTASYYRTDISRWMRPELPAMAEIASPAALARASEHAVAYLKGHAGSARAWFIGLPRPDHPVLELQWRAKPGAAPGRALLDPGTGEPLRVRDTRGGDFLYRFHFELHMAPLWGRWIVGLCAMTMLVALVSGIVTHRRIFSDIFTFRRNAKSAQRSWLDAHNVTGVLALPFHLMITYTGMVTLALMYMPWGVTTAYDGNAQSFYAESGQITPARPPAGRPGLLAPVGPMVEQALALVPEPLERLTINNPGDANATVVAVFEEPKGLAHRHPQVAFDGTTGTVLASTGPLAPAAHAFTGFVGLHEAHFAEPALRILFFLCGLMGSAMVATGLVLWSVARMPKAGVLPSFGLRLVRVLNVGTVAGLPLAVAAYFLANRLLPTALTGRAETEIQVFFAAWLLAALMPLARLHAQAWREALGACAALYLAVPITNALTVARPADAEGAALYLWFDVAMVGLAALFALAAYRVHRRERPLDRQRVTASARRANPRVEDRPMAKGHPTGALPTQRAAGRTE